jgi:dGTPase
MIAYLGKDRQDAMKVKLVTDSYKDNIVGKSNRDIINNIINNVIKNSLDKNYIGMDTPVLNAIAVMKKENTEQIYQRAEVVGAYSVVQEMMGKLYDRLKQDFSSGNFSSPVYQHHINNSIFDGCYRQNKGSREITASSDDIVVDFIASMTDDYFIEIFKYLFPEDALNKEIKYVEYFDGC